MSFYLRFWILSKMSLLKRKTALATFWANLGVKFGHFLFQHLVTLTDIIQDHPFLTKTSLRPFTRTAAVWVIKVYLLPYYIVFELG